MTIEEVQKQTIERRKRKLNENKKSRWRAFHIKTDKGDSDIGAFRSEKKVKI